MTYIVDNLVDYTEELYLFYLTTIPEWRREKALRYKQLDDRKRCVLAFRLLEYALQNEYGITTVPEFVYNEYGKPYLPDLPIHFNLSHCKDAVACVVGDHEVGIDVESITPYNDSVARRICNDEEYQRLVNSSNKDVEFTKLWTEKEAIAKYLGEGFNLSFSNIIPSCYQIYSFVDSHKKYILSCCTGKDQPTISSNDEPLLIHNIVDL